MIDACVILEPLTGLKNCSALVGVSTSGGHVDQQVGRGSKFL